MKRSIPFFVLCASLVACGDNTSPTPTPDASTADVAVDASGDTADASADATGDGATDANVDAGPSTRCGTARPTVTGTRSSEGLTIGPDGTIYYSQPSAIGRITPDGMRDNAWAPITGASTIWGIALDVSRQRLYVGSPVTRAIHLVDFSSGTPTVSMFYANAGQPNGLTIAADGTLYYSDFGGGHVYSLTPDGTRTRVTASTIAQANGVAFYNGSLYVDSYGRGVLWRLTLANGTEMAREMVATGLGSPDGLAFDSAGAAYVTDNAGGRLLRVAPGATEPEELMSGLSAAANVEFGAGVLSCTDLYIATSGGVRRWEDGTVTGLDVPWHH